LARTVSQRERLGVGAVIGDQPGGEEVGERGGEREPAHRIRDRRDAGVDLGRAAPVDPRPEPRHVLQREALLEEEVGEQALAIGWGSGGTQAAEPQRLLDPPGMTHEAIDRLGDEAAIPGAEPAAGAEGARQTVGDEAPVHPRRLPDLEDELAKGGAGGRLPREIPVLRFGGFRH
jgi:hypothetical protein